MGGGLGTIRLERLKFGGLISLLSFRKKTSTIDIGVSHSKTECSRKNADTESKPQVFLWSGLETPGITGTTRQLLGNLDFRLDVLSGVGLSSILCTVSFAPHDLIR